MFSTLENATSQAQEFYPILLKHRLSWTKKLQSVVIERVSWSRRNAVLREHLAPVLRKVRALFEELSQAEECSSPILEVNSTNSLSIPKAKTFLFNNNRRSFSLLPRKTWGLPAPKNLAGTISLLKWVQPIARKMNWNPNVCSPKGIILTEIGEINSLQMPLIPIRNRRILDLIRSLARGGILMGQLKVCLVKNLMEVSSGVMPAS